MGDFKEFVQDLGALAESVKLFYDQCMRVGFSDEQSFEFARLYLAEIFECGREVMDND